MDPIDRQDAIRIVDSIDTWQAGWRSNAIENLKALSSVQPENIRCKDCCHNNSCDIQYHAQAGDMFFCAAAKRRTNEQTN